MTQSRSVVRPIFVPNTEFFIAKLYLDPLLSSFCITLCIILFLDDYRHSIHKQIISLWQEWQRLCGIFRLSKWLLTKKGELHFALDHKCRPVMGRRAMGVLAQFLDFIWVFIKQLMCFVTWNFSAIHIFVVLSIFSKTSHSPLFIIMSLKKISFPSNTYFSL